MPQSFPCCLTLSRSKIGYDETGNPNCTRRQLFLAVFSLLFVCICEQPLARVCVCNNEFRTHGEVGALGLKL